jgi:hypothetical protein
MQVNALENTFPRARYDDMCSKPYLQYKTKYVYSLVVLNRLIAARKLVVVRVHLILALHVGLNCIYIYISRTKCMQNPSNIHFVEVLMLIISDGGGQCSKRDFLSGKQEYLCSNRMSIQREVEVRRVSQLLQVVGRNLVVGGIQRVVDGSLA